MFQDGEKKTISSPSAATRASRNSSSGNRQVGQRQPQRPGRKQTGKCGVTNTGFLRFLFSNFRYSLTALSRGFASFPHGTCTLSVSHQYLAFDGIYHQIRAAIPNNSTRRFPPQALRHTGVSPSTPPRSRGLSPKDNNRETCRPQFDTSADSQAGLLALHSPLLDQS